MKYDGQAKKVKTAEELKQAARVRDAFRLKTKNVVRARPKRSVSY